MIASTPKTAASLSKSRLDMIEAGGRVCQFLGIPRSAGQIYGLLYLSPEPLSLDDIAELLGISKSGASMSTRLLLAWRAIRVAWVPGHKRDYFEVAPNLTNLLRSAYADFVKPRLLSSQKRLERISASLEEEYARGDMTPEEYKVCSDRLNNFAAIQEKLQALVPLVENLL